MYRNICITVHQQNPLMNAPFMKHKCIIRWEDVRANISQIILESIYNLYTISTWIHSHYLWYEIKCVYFGLNKFKSQSITLWYNALPSIIFNYAFHACSTKPYPRTNFSHSHSLHSQLQHSIVKCLKIDSP